MNWIEVRSKADIDQWISRSQSEHQTFLIFKHSTRCSISATAKSRLERAWSPTYTTPVLYIDVLNHRDVSNYVADRLGVQHESPQLIEVADGNASQHLSHLAVRLP
ncbi:MAG TPA: bacillithiol system redox-active protein YtxJ [Luteibaculaceae bacterium]|nr:bacillithiol system redox-active protein YtxJ [Luteibaculaceae bacterium]